MLHLLLLFFFFFRGQSFETRKRASESGIFTIVVLNSSLKSSTREKKWAKGNAEKLVLTVSEKIIFHFTSYEEIAAARESRERNEQNYVKRVPVLTVCLELQVL